MASEKKLPNKPDQLKIVLFNFKGDDKEITPIVSQLSIHEDLFTPFSSCSFIITDALGLTERFPIIGDERIRIEYKTFGEKFKLRTRTYKLYKTGKRVESSQRQYNYIVHGIEEFAIRQEMLSVNKSFVGQKVTKAIQSIYDNASLGNQNTRPAVIPKLYGKGTDNIKDSKNETTYVGTGNTPMEAIQHLKQEAIHIESPSNNSDYVFFQNVDGFHFTTIGELKKYDEEYQDGEENKNEFLLGDQAFALDTPDTRFTPQNIILNAVVKKTVDTIQNLGTGLYHNRVAVVDPLTKRYDYRNFTYFAEFKTLELLGGVKGGRGQKDGGKRIISKESPFRYAESSTHTRYMVGELTTNRLNPSSPTKQFTGGINYKDSPYIKEAVDIDRDPKIKFPNERHKVLNKKIAERAALDTMILDLLIPANSDLKVGDIIYVFAPQATGSTTSQSSFNIFYGNESSRFLITNLEHKYVAGTANFTTRVEVMKDSFEFSPETIREKVESEFTE